MFKIISDQGLPSGVIMHTGSTTVGVEGDNSHVGKNGVEKNGKTGSDCKHCERSC